MDDVNLFEDARLLLSAANNDILEFEKMVADVKSNVQPIHSIGEEPMQWFFTLANPDLPKPMKITTFSIVTKLRSALDHAVYASNNALQSAESTNTKFPIAASNEDFENEFKQKSWKKVHPELIALLKSFNSTKLNSPLIYALNNIRNTKSHRLLLPMLTSPHFVGSGDPTPGLKSQSIWHADRNTLEIRSELDPNTPFAAQTHVLRLNITIGDGILKGKIAVDAFRGMYIEVGNIVDRIASETSLILSRQN